MDNSPNISMALSSIAIVISVISLFLSWKQHRQDQNRGGYDKKIELKRRIELLFEQPRSYYSAIYGLCGVRVKPMPLHKNEKDELIFGVEKVFGKDISKNLSKILGLYEEAKSINNDINRLLDNLEHRKREELGKILQEEYSNELGEMSEKNLAYQQGITIIFMQQEEGETRSKYNFYDLKLELEKKDKEISEEVEDFMKSIKHKIKFK